MHKPGRAESAGPWLEALGRAAGGRCCSLWCWSCGWFRDTVKEEETGGKLHGWLHLWVTGLQGAQAKPLKPGHHFAAVNAATGNRNKGYGPAGLGRVRRQELRSGPIPEAHGGPALRGGRFHGQRPVVSTELLLVEPVGSPASATRPLEGGGLCISQPPASRAQDLPWARLSCLLPAAQGSSCSQRNWEKGHLTPELSDTTSSCEKWASHAGEHQGRLEVRGAQGRPPETGFGSWGPRNLHLATMQGLWVPCQPHSR